MFHGMQKVPSLLDAGRSGTRMVIKLALLVALFSAANGIVLAQEVTTSTGGKKTSTTNASPGRSGSGYRRNRLRGSRPAASGASRSSASEQSDNFVELGDQFAERSRWRAAEIAYKEAIALWSGNADAWMALGELYVNKGLLGDAYGPYNKLLSLDSQGAAYLIGEIKSKSKKE